MNSDGKLKELIFNINEKRFNRSCYCCPQEWVDDRGGEEDMVATIKDLLDVQFGEAKEEDGVFLSISQDKVDLAWVGVPCRRNE